MKEVDIYLCLICLIGLLSGCKSSTKQQNVPNVIPVKTVAVQITTETNNRTYVGTVEEEYGSQLSFSTMGTVKQVLVDEGQAVSKGQTLAILDKTTVQNAYDIAHSTLTQAQDAYKRLYTLYKKGSLPEVKYIEIQTQLAQAQAGERIARKNMSDCVLHAPFAGYIAKKSVDAGNNVVPGFSCFKLVKLDQVKVKVSIPEKEISSIHKGQSIDFTVAALNGKNFVGKVKEIGVQANPLSHTYDVKLELANKGHLLLPGMVCSANIGLQASTATILPQEAVMIDGSNTFVWITKGDQAEKRRVSTGGVNDQGVIITDGLSEGDEVIVSGQENVSEGTKIKRI